MSLLDALTRLKRLDKVQVLSGLQGSVAPGDEGLPELVVIATAHEFGLGVPSRPFMRESVHAHGHQWADGMREAVSAFAIGDIPESEHVFRLVGQKMTGDIQMMILNGDWVPNSAATIDQKGSSKPLIDTGQMRQSIRAAVETDRKTSFIV